MSMNCNVCGAKNEESSKFCWNCGAVLEQEFSAPSQAPVHAGRSVRQTGKKKKWIPIAAVAAIIMVIVFTAAASMDMATPAATIKKLEHGYNTLNANEVLSCYDAVNQQDIRDVNDAIRTVEKRGYELEVEYDIINISETFPYEGNECCLVQCNCYYRYPQMTWANRSEETIYPMMHKDGKWKISNELYDEYVSLYNDYQNFISR